MPLGIEHEALCDFLAQAHAYSLHMLAQPRDVQAEQISALLWHLHEREAWAVEVVKHHAEGRPILTLAPLTEDAQAELPTLQAQPTSRDAWQTSRAELIANIQLLSFEAIHAPLQAPQSTIVVSELVKRLVSYEYARIKPVSCVHFEDWYRNE